ncbi:DNA adenine methylase [Georhizobium sp. MAB10]|uniref:DNA adenine methylase n=1 Tax=Georhizobium sp. MAB10 TaxID=3028319 RepID=UPI0038557BD5
MKYMGSKRAMLGNGLGEALGRSLDGANRVLDLFTGSAAVAWYVAERFRKEVHAGDLQQYSTVIAASVIERTSPISDFDWLDRWMTHAEAAVMGDPRWRDIQELQDCLHRHPVTHSAASARAIDFDDKWPISKAYGGYYFSPWQSMWLDALRKNLPDVADQRNVALAALIQSASRCAASPGHTAQPFKPNETAGRFLIEAWQRNLPEMVRVRVSEIAPRTAFKKGRAYCLNAHQLAETARPNDLVFLDPPYSGVHYSRFYHVLESVARGEVGEVSGSGRYPSKDERPTSEYSMLSTSKHAFDDLLAILARQKANVIVTFPAGKASNGLSGDDVRAIAADHFRIQEAIVTSRFSTMGGDLKHRAARQDADELILTLSSRAG